MLTKQDAEARVAKGAAHLDQVRPGWFNRIDVGTLTLHDPCGCIVGQLCATGEDFSYGAEILGLSHGASGTAVMFGFDLTFKDSDFQVRDLEAFACVQDAWVAAIADRRLASPIVETAPVLTRADDAVPVRPTVEMPVTAR